MVYSADRLIQERQRHEAKYEALLASNLDQTKVKQKAVWENKCGNLQRNNAVRRKVSEILQGRSESLMERRKKLGSLLAHEQKQYEKEIAENEETPQERLQKTVTRAVELKTQREESRQRVVQEKMYQQWREGVDDLRKMDSQLFCYEVLAARDDQVYEKSLRQDVVDAEADHYSKLWMEGYAAKVEREIKEEELKLKRNKEMEEVLKFQVDWKEKAREVERAKILVEEEEMKRLWAEQRIEADEEVIRNSVVAKLDRKKVDKFAAIQKSMREDIEARDKEIDKSFVMQAMKESKEQSQADMEARIRSREEALQHAQAIKMEMARRSMAEKEDESHLAVANEKEWNKKQEKWDRESEAREKLRVETYVGREQQVILKEQERNRAKEEVKEDRQRLDSEANRLSKFEEERLEAEALVKKRHQEELFRQMDFHQVQRARAMQQFNLERRDGEIQEQKFQRAMKQEKQKLDTLSRNIVDTRVLREKERDATKATKLVPPWEK